MLSNLDDMMAIFLTYEYELATDIEQADDNKHKIYTAIASIEKAIAPTPPTGLCSVLDHASTHDNLLLLDAASRVRLPNLSIRPFDGDITKWTSFWDSFKSAIHGNKRLSTVDKFKYFQSLLKRTVIEAIFGLSLTEANYTEAVEILQKRFSSKQQLISSIWISYSNLARY